MPCDFSSAISFSFSFSIRAFRRLPSLATVSSVPVHYSFFLYVCGFGRLAWLFHSLILLSMVYFPLFPSGSSLPFSSLGALLTRSTLRFTPRRGLPLGRIRSCLASLHSSFASLSLPIDLSLCLHSPASLPPLLQSAVPYCYFLSSRGFSLLPPACSQSQSCVRCLSRFTICYFPRGASLRSLLLSSFLQLLKGLLSFLWTFSSFLLGLGLVFIGNFQPIGFLTFRFGSSLLVFSACWVSLPCVLRLLLFLASLGYVPAFFCFPSFVTLSNLSSFATGSSLRAESLLSVLSCLLSHGFASCPPLLVSFLICFDFSPSFSSLCRFPST